MINKKKHQIFGLNELSHKPDHSTLVKYNFGCVKKGIKFWRVGKLASRS